VTSAHVSLGLSGRVPAAAQSKPAALLASVGNTCEQGNARPRVSATAATAQVRSACRRGVAAKDRLAVVQALRLLQPAPGQRRTAGASRPQRWALHAKTLPQNRRRTSQAQSCCAAPSPSRVTLARRAASAGSAKTAGHASGHRPGA
jgi:hypothetical protein